MDTATGFINRRGANSDVYNELFRLKGKSEYKSEHPLSPYLPYSITVDEVRERSKAKHHSKPKHNPSSTYKIIYNLDPNYGKITAEFSLPKYIYGTNIIQSVENVNEKDFTFSTDKFNIDHHVKDCYDRFYKMINQYFKNEFPLCKIDFTQIEITRIDLCFNHIFETKTDAFAYLDLMKESKRNYQRSTHPTGRYETSFMHVSGNDYSFKAYLKGPEYARDDAPEHRKINKLKNKQIFDVDFLQQTADKIIRYEITCRRQYFDYHHNFKLNRKNSREHSLLRKIFTSMDTFYNGKTSDYAQNSKLLEYEQYTSPVTNETWSVPLPISIAITELEKIEEIANKYANHHVYGSKSIDFISLIFTKKLYDHLTEKEKCKLMRDFHTRFRKLLDFSRIYTLTIDQDDKRDYLEDYKMRMLHPSTVFTSQKKVPFGKDLLESLCYKLFDLIGQIQVSRR
ncbi:MAG: hypothetical protein H7331_00390, partial [Bacteroidia bacterium]|nr:hypothetical protein [Bacteroidia bacterium]